MEKREMEEYIQSLPSVCYTVHNQITSFVDFTICFIN